MPNFERISSKDNQLVKTAVSLVGSAKARKESNMFVLDGLRLCRDAVLNSFPVEAFIVSENAYDKFRQDADFIAEKSEKCYIVPSYIIEKISDTVNPQGFICICKMKENDGFVFDKNKLYIGLENLQDPSNLGAVSRSAEAFAFGGILVSSNGCDPYGPKALRASMGALLRIPVIDIGYFPSFLANCDLTSFAAVVDADAKHINDVKFKAGSLILVGNEANGLTSETISAADFSVTIPMTGKAESLNAATAASILIWEMSRGL